METFQTVLGPKPLYDMGKTLPHEHLTGNFVYLYRLPPDYCKEKFTSTIDLQNIGYIKRYPYSNIDNLRLDDRKSRLAINHDVQLFSKRGGKTIIEQTGRDGMNRDIDFLRKLSKNTEVNIVVGTGYFCYKVQTAAIERSSQEDLYKTMFRDICNGLPYENPSDPSVIKAGFIGEIVTGWPMRECDKKVIRAAAEVQSETLCAVSLHPGNHKEAPYEVMRTYLEAGGNVHKVVVSHVDSIFNEWCLYEFIEFHKCYVQLDLFGLENCFHSQVNPDIRVPMDVNRIEVLEYLRKEKLLNRVLLSHDIHTKHRLTQFGGHGYTYIQDYIIPALENKGFEKKEISQITTENPKDWLSRSKI